MSTSGSYSFSVTRDDIIRQAMLNIKRLDPDDAPSPSELNDCARVLNMMVKQWMGKTDFAPGLKVWTRARVHVLLNGSGNGYTLNQTAQGVTTVLNVGTVASNAAQSAASVVLAGLVPVAGQTLALQGTDGNLEYYTISSVAGQTASITPSLTVAVNANAAAYMYAAASVPPALLEIESAILRDNTNSDTPLRIFTVQDWDMLPNKMDPTNQGDPIGILYEPGINQGVLWTDCGSCQDVSKHMILTGFLPVQDFVNPLDNPQYPQEWYLALCWGLAEQISPMFGANWGQKEESLKHNAIMIARNKGSEISSMYFQPGAED